MAKPTPLAAAIAAIRDQLGNLQNEIDGLEAERAAIAGAPPHRSDLFAAVDGWLESQAGDYRRALAKALGDISAIPLEVDERLTSNSPRYPIDLLGLSSRAFGAPPPECASAAGLILLAGDTIRDSLHREIERWIDGQPEGLPLEQRRVELARLDSELTDRREKLATLVAEAAAAGVSLTI